MGTMTRAHVAAIYIAEAEGAPVQDIPEVRAVPGRGLEGDRNFAADELHPAESGQDLTLVEAEAMEALVQSGIDIGLGGSRRNVVTRGIGLNDLVGKRFRVGDVQCQGIRLCHPCDYLESITQPGVLKGLANRGGLRADILIGGTIRAGDAIVVQDVTEPATAYPV
jgi:MOSC domain-containing protein YiiM